MINRKQFSSQGSGHFTKEQISLLGKNVIFEEGVLIFHPENVEIGNNVYIGHRTILKAYHQNKLQIGNNTWIGQDCFFHSGGGIVIGNEVGIGPKVSILTSQHRPGDNMEPVLFSPLEFQPVTLEDGCDIGVNSTIYLELQLGRVQLLQRELL